MSEEIRFETTGILDEAFYKENARYLLSPKFHHRRLILALVIVIMCLSGYCLLNDRHFLHLLIIYAVAYVPFTLWYRRSAAKTSIKRHREIYPDGKCELTTACTPEGVRSENLTTGGVGVVKYEHLHTLARADHAFILMTKAGQFTVFFTDGLSAQEQSDLRAHLCEKCPKLKIIR